MLISETIYFEYILVVIQSYEAEADNEYVIRGNSAIMKCEIPSYVADFVSVDLWIDSNGGSYHPNNEQAGIVLISDVARCCFLLANKQLLRVYSFVCLLFTL